MEQKKTREELIRQCRYYKGEEECPIGVPHCLWTYECHWVNASHAASAFLDNYVQEYISYGLASFSTADHVPLSLKAVLYNRFSHWLGCRTDDFKKWYNKEYLGGEVKSK